MTSPLDDLDAQQRAGVTAIWFTPESDGQEPVISLEMLGGPKRYAQIWLDHLSGTVQWGWGIPESAICVWRESADGD